MNEHLFKHVDLKKENIHIPKGDVVDIDTERNKFERELNEVAPLDVQILGVGLNGHIGFIEPDSELSAEPHVLNLTEHTREVNAAAFNSIEDVPYQALTMGVGNILSANLYMKYRVNEYWIVNPMLKSITVYVLNANGMYEQFDIKTESGKVRSHTLVGFDVDIEYIFK